MIEHIAEYTVGDVTVSCPMETRGGFHEWEHEGEVFAAPINKRIKPVLVQDGKKRTVMRRTFIRTDVGPIEFPDGNMKGAWELWNEDAQSRALQLSDRGQAFVDLHQGKAFLKELALIGVLPVIAAQYIRGWIETNKLANSTGFMLPALLQRWFGELDDFWKYAGGAVGGAYFLWTFGISGGDWIFNPEHAPKVIVGAGIFAMIWAIYARWAKR